MSPYYSKDILSVLVKIIIHLAFCFVENTELLAGKKLLKEKDTFLQFGNQYITRNTCQFHKLTGYFWMSRMQSQWLSLSTYWNCEIPKALVKHTCRCVRVFSDRITWGRRPAMMRVVASEGLRRWDGWKWKRRMSAEYWPFLFCFLVHGDESKFSRVLWIGAGPVTMPSLPLWVALPKTWTQVTLFPLNCLLSGLGHSAERSD